MRIISKLFAGVVIAIVSSGCGTTSSHDAAETVGNTLKDYKIMGTWGSSCTESKILHASMKEFYTFDGNNLSKVREFYSKSDCTDPIVRVAHEGTFGIDFKNDLGENSRNIDFDYKTASVTPLTDGGVTLLNATHFCGEKDWKVNTAFDLTKASEGITCPLDQAKSVYDIVRVDGDQLYFGHGGPKNTTKERPTALDKDAPFARSKG